MLSSAAAGEIMVERGRAAKQLKRRTWAPMSHTAMWSSLQDVRPATDAPGTVGSIRAAHGGSGVASCGLVTFTTTTLKEPA